MYVVGEAHNDLSAGIVIPHLANNNPFAPPASPTAYDDEFPAGVALDPKWSFIYDDSTVAAPLATQYGQKLDIYFQAPGSNKLVAMAQDAPSGDFAFEIGGFWALGVADSVGIYMRGTNGNGEVDGFDTNVRSLGMKNARTDSTGWNITNLSATAGGHVGPINLSRPTFLRIAVVGTTISTYVGDGKIFQLAMGHPTTWWLGGSIAKIGIAIRYMNNLGFARFGMHYFRRIA